MSKKIKGLSVLLIAIFCLTFCGCNSGSFIIASTDISTVSKQSLSVAASNAYITNFTNASTELLTTFGNKDYTTYNVCIAGNVSKADAALNSTPIDEDGNTITDLATQEVSYYTDYIHVAFKINNVTKTIAFTPNSMAMPIDKKRVINNYYYLNLKWLKVSADKTTFSPHNYEHENYLYVKTNSSNASVQYEFLIHITYDLNFM